MVDDPHAGQPVLAAGRPLAEAQGAVILVHGRGATAESILSLAAELPHPGLAYLAPQAAGHTWYPQPFLAPLAANEPYLSSALAALDRLVARIAAAGIPADRTVILGFSQGACLSLEYAARHPRRFGGVVALTGGLIGPPGPPRSVTGSLAGTPVFLGAGDPDPHVPRWRVEETAELLRELEAEVTLRIYPGLGHTINTDELQHARRMLAGLELFPREARESPLDVAAVTSGFSRADILASIREGHEERALEISSGEKPVL